MDRSLFSIGIGAAAIIAVIVGGLWYQQQYVFPSTNLTASIQDAATNQLSKLSQDQKIGQLFIMGFDGTESDSFEHFINNHPVGGVLLLEKNIRDAAQLQKLTTELQKGSHISTKTPLLIAIDQEGGDVSRIPFIEEPNAAQSEINNSKQAYTIAKKRGENLYNLGINLNFSPVLDIAQNTTSFIWSRSFHGDVQLISTLGVAFVQGYTDADIIACPKHFPGHGDTTTDPHTTVSINTQPIKTIIKQSQPFADVIGVGVQCIMVGHSLEKNADSLPASQSPTILQDWLREAFHFTGIIITDDMEMEAARPELVEGARPKLVEGARPELVEGAHTKTQSIAQASIAALQAGADMIVISGHTTTQQEREKIYDEISAAIKNGALTQKQLDEKISRIFHLKSIEVQPQ